jgi:hypothetical protein
MTDDYLGQWESAFERRSVARTKIAKDARLFFAGKLGVQSCIVRDITSVGAGFRIRELPALPLNFEMTFDNFRTLAKVSADLAGWGVRWRGVQSSVSYSLLVSAAYASTTSSTAVPKLRVSRSSPCLGLGP